MDKTDLLTLLRESESYVSGQDICNRFGVSRTAVWKAINRLRADGYEIEAVSNRGYRLGISPDVMSRDEILSRLTTAYIGRELYYYDETDSTNARIRALADAGNGGLHGKDEGNGAPNGTLAVSDMQSAGRGRRGRGWSSPAGSNIYMSLLLKPDIAPSDAPMITLIMAYAVCGAIREVTGAGMPVLAGSKDAGADGELPDVRIKWPNDIVVNGRKVCGILTEMTMEADYIRDVTVGVGINVNQGERDLFPEEIRESATSIRLETGEMICRAGLIARIMSLFEKEYDEFLKTGDLGFLKARYEDRLVSMGREVRVLDPKGEYTGISRGIDERGELLVETSDGAVQRVYAGEVSVRGIYGYV